METFKILSGILICSIAGLWSLASGGLGLITPSTWVHMRWFGLRVRWRGIEEKDLNTFGGRLKIFVFNVFALIASFFPLFGAYALLRTLLAN
jgi:hypothetical protein